MARKADSLFWQRLEAIQRSGLPPRHKLLLVWLWKYAGDDGECFPKQKQIAADMSLSKRQVIRLLSELSGVVTVSTVGTRNRYSINWDALPDARPAKQKGDTRVTNRGQTKVTPTTPKGDASVTNKVTPTSPSSSYVNHNETSGKPQRRGSEFQDDVCERIYQAYPRKVGKKKALDAIKTALKRPRSHAFAVTADELLSAVGEFAAAVQGADQQFIPYPATWFGQSRWTDDRADWQRIGRSQGNSRQPSAGAGPAERTGW